MEHGSSKYVACHSHSITISGKIMQLETRNWFMPRKQFCLAIFRVSIKVASDVTCLYKLVYCTGTNQLRAKLLDGTKTKFEAYFVKGHNKALNTRLTLTTDGLSDQ
jgi:predicted transcriptional regulator of viral defense system